MKRPARYSLALGLATGLLVAAAPVISAAPPGDRPASRAASDPDGTKPPVEGDAALVRSLVTAGDGGTTIDTEPATGVVSFVGFPAGTGWPGSGDSGNPSEVAEQFLVAYGPLFGVRPADLAATPPAPTPGGGEVVRYTQRHRGLPVFGAGLTIEVDEAGRVVTAAGKTVPEIEVAPRPRFTRDQARERARSSGRRMWQQTDPAAVSADKPTPLVVDPALFGRAARSAPTLAWQVRVETEGNEGAQAGLVLIDADDGETISAVELTPEAKNRRVCDNANNPNLADTCLTPLRAEGAPATGVADVDRAYDFLGQSYDFFFSRFARDSIDGAGSSLNAVVRYCEFGECPYGNAYYDGDDTLLFGSGWVTDDVVAHELVHAITDHEANLAYIDQSGAINESMSDVFGEFIDLVNPSPEDAGARWRLGESLAGGALRNMQNPGEFLDPDRLLSTRYLAVPIGAPCDDDNDYCGVHTNSGIGNKAAFLITDGGTFNGFTVTGLGIEKAARVYYRALLLLSATSRYRDLYHALRQGCQNALADGGAFAPTAADCTEVQDAVDATQMKVAAADAAGGAVQNLPECTANLVPRVDDGSTGPVALPFPVNFFGATHSSLFINDNGNVTFGAPYAAFNPTPLTAATLPIIAPFFSDVLTEHPRSDAITYGASADAKVFCVNWAGEGVAYASPNPRKLNRFQLLLVDRSADGAPGDFDIVFNYGQVTWESGDQSGGALGLGGNSARAGYSAGTGAPATAFELDGSGVPGAFLDSNPRGLAKRSSYSPTPGRHIFQVRSTPSDLVTTPGGYTALNPARILDTRFANGQPGTNPVPGNSIFTLQVTGRGGVPTSGISAVVLNVTVTAPQTAGFVTVHPAGTTTPTASNLNFVPGQTVPNLVVAPLGTGGRVSLFLGGTGTAHLVADVTGYYLDGAVTTAGAFAPLNPARLLDTRFANGQPGTNPVPGNSIFTLQVTGRGGVPTSGISAVVLNVTVTAPQTAGYVTVHPAGTPTPTASNLNFVPGQTVPNLVVAPLGTDGKISLFLGGTGTAHLVADVTGYYLDGAVTTAGAFAPLNPARLLDTRFANGQPGTNPVPGNSIFDLQVTGRGGVPASGISAVVLNVTVTQPQSAGYVTVHPSGTPTPTASNLNFVPGQTVPNLVVAPLGPGGRVSLSLGGTGTAHLVADVTGFVRSTNAALGPVAASATGGQVPAPEGRTYARTTRHIRPKRTNRIV